MKFGPIIVIVQKHSTQKKTLKAIQDLSIRLKLEAIKLNAIISKLNTIGKDN